MARKKKSSLNNSSMEKAAGMVEGNNSSVSLSLGGSRTPLSGLGAGLNNGSGLNSGSELVLSPLVHPSAGLITRSEHEIILGSNRALGILDIGNGTVNSGFGGNAAIPVVDETHELDAMGEVMKEHVNPPLGENTGGNSSAQRRLDMNKQSKWIASILGVPLFADDCTPRQQRVSFACVLVEMDVTKTLSDHVWIEDELGVEFKQAIVYDWKPSYCAKCSMPGHDCSFLGNPVQKHITKQPTKQIWVPNKQQQGQKSVPAQVATPEH
uniref:Uncharacterized protein n=1 Tax=Chenopodium quinoa TaxID=63459 RepID=A0A803N0J3_CHEQI